MVHGSAGFDAPGLHLVVEDARDRADGVTNVFEAGPAGVELSAERALLFGAAAGGLDGQRVDRGPEPGQYVVAVGIGRASGRARGWSLGLLGCGAGLEFA